MAKIEFIPRGARGSGNFDGIWLKVTMTYADINAKPIGVADFGIPTNIPAGYFFLDYMECDIKVKFASATTTSLLFGGVLSGSTIVAVGTSVELMQSPVKLIQSGDMALTDTSVIPASVAQFNFTGIETNNQDWTAGEVDIYFLIAPLPV